MAQALGIRQMGACCFRGDVDSVLHVLPTGQRNFRNGAGRAVESADEPVPAVGTKLHRALNSVLAIRGAALQGKGPINFGTAGSAGSRFYSWRARWRTGQWSFHSRRTCSTSCMAESTWKSRPCSHTLPLVPRCGAQRSVRRSCCGRSNLPDSIFYARIVASVLSLIVGVPATCAFGLWGVMCSVVVANLAALVISLYILQRKSNSMGIPNPVLQGES